VCPCIEGQQKKGKARLRAYEELCDEANKFTQRDDMDSITIPAAPRLGSTVINAEGVCKGFDGRGLLIDDMNCMIPPGAVVGIVGANGAGKSTLFKMITGDDKPDAGGLVVGETVQLMYQDQNRDSLNDDKTARTRHSPTSVLHLSRFYY
jgi:sulfate-transporting ATPase